MHINDREKIVNEVRQELAVGRSFALLALSCEATSDLLELFAAARLISGVEAVFSPHSRDFPADFPVLVRPLPELSDMKSDVLIVVEDALKESILEAATPHISGTPRVMIGGYGHFAFNDPMFSAEVDRLEVASLANGYPNSLIHLYQCLKNASRLGLSGVVAEFGIYRGGTTMLMSRFIEALGEKWKVIGFDTFDGFPPRRSPLDMYNHPGCVCTDKEAVFQYLAGRNIEIVVGDIVRTSQRLATEDVVLSFLDTDNYSPARAALEVVQERTVVGGAIVFDHLTGVDRFKYTLGERIAAKTLLGDARYFNLHGTGVFIRQR